MTTLNAYASLGEFKSYVTSRGGISLPANVTDDLVLEQLLKSASETVENETSRRYNPFVETRYFDVPAWNNPDPRELKLDADLLEVITLTNGDGTVIPSTEYILRQSDMRGVTPYSNIRLKSTSTFWWSPDSSGEIHSVISLIGIWGYHNRYGQAWQLATTAAEGMDATETGFDVTSGAGFAVGNLIRFDNELGYVSSIATNTLTITRGENGSTAATHLTGINVYIWQPMISVKNLVCELASVERANRFGQKTNNADEVMRIAGKFYQTHRRFT